MFRSLATLGLIGWLCCTPLMVLAAPLASSDDAFHTLVDAYFTDRYKAHPSQATADGFHQYDAMLEDPSQTARVAEVQSLHSYLQRFGALDPKALSPDALIDRDIVMNSLRGQLQSLEVIRGWQKNPDEYSSGLSFSAYTLISRTFAPPEERLQALVAREEAMPAVLQAARSNLQHCPKEFTQIALQQLPDTIGFFKNDVPAAFKDVPTEPVVERFHQTNAAVIAALEDYQQWLKTDILPHSDGDFRIGADTYARKLQYDEMVDIPLDRLLQVGLDNMHANQQWFRQVAHQLDPKRLPQAILAELEKTHPPPDKLLDTFRKALVGLKAFIETRHLLTIPSPVMPILEETPPFDRALTMASMDIPGPYETVAKEAYFNVTLPEPDWDPKRTEEHMEGFNYGTIISTATHEAFPGHYIQYLYLQLQPDKVRKLITCASCSEGWAHYCEQMMLDEGYGKGDLRLRLGQLQDALLRNARLVVGIQMHRGKMTVEQATAFIIKEGYQTPANARLEAMRGTSDPTYLYYTVGKLEILKLRADYMRLHPKATVADFHNAFLKQGIIPIKLIRRIMLGQDGSVL